MKVPKTILDDPRIKQMYEQFVKTQGGKGKMKGMGVWDSFVDFLKRSKVISNVGGVLLPAAGGVLGGTVGTALGGPAGTALGTTAGTVAGKSAADYIRSLGFGKRMRGGDSRLVINPPGTRLGQKGMKMKGKGCGCGKMKGGAVTYGINGVYQNIPGTVPERKMIGGQSASFNAVASQFGNVKF